MPRINKKKNKNTKPKTPPKPSHNNAIAATTQWPQHHSFSRRTHKAGAGGGQRTEIQRIAARGGKLEHEAVVAAAVATGPKAGLRVRKRVLRRPANGGVDRSRQGKRHQRSRHIIGQASHALQSPRRGSGTGGKGEVLSTNRKKGLVALHAETTARLSSLRQATH